MAAAVNAVYVFQELSADMEDGQIVRGLSCFQLTTRIFANDVGQWWSPDVE